jgi:hypothetical protein
MRIFARYIGIDSGAEIELMTSMMPTALLLGFGAPIMMTARRPS